MLILDLWGVSFHAVVVFGVGKNPLFKSILGRCDIVPNPSTTLFHIHERKLTSNGTQYADSNATHAID